MSLVDGYATITTPPTKKDGKKVNEKKSKAKGTIMSSIYDLLFVKVMDCKNEKDIWDKLQKVYKGDTNVKGDKLQTLRSKFEKLNMKEDEDIEPYLIQVGERVNTIRGLGVEFDELVSIQNILISLPMIFDHKISSLK
jgi:hypothetical protein